MIKFAQGYILPDREINEIREREREREREINRHSYTYVYLTISGYVIECMV